MGINELTANSRAKVVKINASPKITARLNSLGLTEGANCKLIRIAPLGDPILIEVKGVSLALRLDLARKIQVIIE